MILIDSVAHFRSYSDYFVKRKVTSVPMFVNEYRQFREKVNVRDLLLSTPFFCGVCAKRIIGVIEFSVCVIGNTKQEAFCFTDILRRRLRAEVFSLA